MITCNNGMHLYSAEPKSGELCQCGKFPWYSPEYLEQISAKKKLISLSDYERLESMTVVKRKHLRLIKCKNV